MKRMFENVVRNEKLASILTVALGAVLFIWPGKTLETVVSILGIGLLALGAVWIVSWYRSRQSGPDYSTLAMGILSAVAGVVVLSAPRFIVSVLPVLVGIAILLNGVFNLAKALDLRRAGYSRWLGSLIMAVITLVMGAIVVLNPFSTVKLLVMVIGAIFMYNGISNLWIGSRYRKVS